MKWRSGSCFIGAVALVALGCSEKPFVGDGRQRPEPAPHRAVRIVFTVPGDDIGGQESQRRLEEVKAAILHSKVGGVISSGYGMGSMEILVAFDNDGSIEEIRRVIGGVYPGGRYRLELTAR